jgi:hypothetical protein
MMRFATSMLIFDSFNHQSGTNSLLRYIAGGGAQT